MNKILRAGALLLCTLFIAFLLPMPVFATASQTLSKLTLQSSTQPNSASNPYLIRTVAELKTIGSALSSGESFAGVYFKLSNDIALAERAWTPIGAEKPFDGFFDGGGNTVTGLNVKNHAFGGLFGMLASGASVSNLNVEGTVTADSSLEKIALGGIAGASTGASVYNCSFSGTVTGEASDISYCAGIIGNAVTSSVTNCSAKGTITARGGYSANVAAGIAAMSSSSISSCENNASIIADGNGNVAGGGIAALCSAGSVRACYNGGSVTATVSSSSNPSRSSYAGGIVGFSDNCAVSESKNSAPIKATLSDSSSATTPSTAACGGIVGLGRRTSVLTCSNSADITASNPNSNAALSSASCAGGIVGTSQGGGTIKNCSNTGNVGAYGSLSTVSGTNHAGGIVGDLDASLYNSYSTGNVTSRGGKESYAGGIASHVTGTVENCYSAGTVTASESNDYLSDALVAKSTGTVRYCYWRKTDNSTSFYQNCGFYSADLSLSTVSNTPVIVSGTACSTVVQALNIWVNNNSDNTYFGWGVSSSQNGGNPVMSHYKITCADIENGTLSFNRTVANEGDVIEITVTPNSGYSLAPNSLTFNGTAVAIKNGVYTFIMPDKDVTVFASFIRTASPIYTISSNAVHGSLIPNVASAEQGAKITVSVNPESNFKLVEGSLKYNGKEILNVNGQYTFTMPAEHVVLTADFAEVAPIARPITIASMTNGTIIPSSASATNGSVVTLTAKPDIGYRLKEGSLKVDGKVLTAVNGVYSFTMGYNAVTVTAEFELAPVTSRPITIAKTENGSIEVVFDSAAKGTVVTGDILPADGYQLVEGSLTYNGIPAEVSGTTFRFTMPDEAVTITAQFELIPPAVYAITVSPTIANGKVTVDFESAQAGEIVTITVICAEGYRLQNGSLRCNGTQYIVAEDGTCKFAMPEEDVFISATFEAFVEQETYYNIHIVDDIPNGLITASASSAIEGSTITVFVFPDDGFSLKNGTLKYNSTAISRINGQFEFVMPASDVTLSAIFERAGTATEIFTITASAQEGGNILPHGAVDAVQGYDKGFAITPNMGYSIRDVLVDGVSVGAVSVYTFEDVMGDHTIEAFFVPVTNERADNAPNMVLLIIIAIAIAFVGALIVSISIFLIRRRQK